MEIKYRKSVIYQSSIGRRRGYGNGGHAAGLRGRAGTTPIGIWGERHLRYIREHRKALYTELLTSGRLDDYLAELNGEAEDMLFRLVKQLTEKEGVTEALKAEDAMKWTQAMNYIRNRAEEVVYSDLIYN